MFKMLAPIAAAALATVSLTAGAVGVFNEFTVDETVVPGANVPPFNLANPALVGDKLTGSYQERLTITGPGTFSAQAFGRFNDFLANDGTTSVTSLLNGFNTIGGYHIYFVFDATGAVTGPNSFASTNNNFTLWLDPDQDTDATLTDGVTAPALVGDGEDIQLAFAGPPGTFGTGNLNGPPGAFNIDWSNFTLTAFGATYFTDPDPFYLNVRVNGDYDVLTPIAIGDTINITGDVSGVFQVPEPTTLALTGLALVAVGLSRRRKTV